MHALCPQVDLRERAGQEGLRSQVETLLGKVKRKYKEYGINERPFVVVKPDTGSSSRGILTLRDAKDIDALLQAGAELPAAGALLVQEGVPTYERMHDAVAEPVVYMIDRYVVGGFYRVHAERGIDENLAVPGSAFVPLAFEPSAQLPRRGEKPGASAPNRFYMYGVIGRLAMAAASYELEATDPEAEAYD
jgi:glutamate--cysteine ligase